MGESLEYQQALIYAEELRELFEEQKARADELEAARAALESAFERAIAAERVRDEFVANCSHELRSPLTPIMGYAKVLLTRDVSADAVREFAQTILNQGERLLKVIESLLRVASIRRDYLATHEVVLETDLREVLGAAAEKATAAGRRVEVIVKPGAERVLVEGGYLDEVMGHLIDNALKFTPAESPIELTVAAEDSMVVIKLIDHGPGLPQPLRERIFTSFTQGDSSSTRRYGGLGLGLYICRELLQSQGGRIWVEDTPGGGATFILTVPQSRQAAARGVRGGSSRPVV